MDNTKCIVDYDFFSFVFRKISNFHVDEDKSNLFKRLVFNVLTMTSVEQRKLSMETNVDVLVQHSHLMLNKPNKNTVNEVELLDKPFEAFHCVISFLDTLRDVVSFLLNFWLTSRCSFLLREVLPFSITFVLMDFLRME